MKGTDVIALDSLYGIDRRICGHQHEMAYAKGCSRHPLMQNENIRTFIYMIFKYILILKSCPSLTSVSMYML